MFRKLVFLLLLSLFNSAGATSADALTSADTQVSSVVSEKHFAKIADDTISIREYLDFLQSQVRKRYYHGAIPEAELKEFAREVGLKLLDETLLLQEAKRRNIQPDDAWVEPRLQRFIEQSRNNPVWKEHGANITESVRTRLQNRSLLKILEQQVRFVPTPSTDDVAAYYAKHPEKFTEPQRDRVAVILLGVDPSSSRSVWEAAKGQADALWQEIQLGADFAELAQESSTDKSASKGGDMGYLHRGMLGDEAQKVLDELSVGEVSKPVRILDGIILLRLVERIHPSLNPLDKVRNRASDLLQRELGENAWLELQGRLFDETRITMNHDVYDAIRPLGAINNSGVNTAKLKQEE